jgi:N-acetylmuramoyl-L-alanine amidase
MFKAIIRFFKELFSKDEPVLLPQPHKPEPIPLPDRPRPEKQKVAIIVGHHKKSKGAVAYTGESEWDWNNNVAVKVKYHLQGYAQVKIFYRDERRSYKSAMKDIAKRVAEWGADFSLELHFNSYEKVAYGCEILIAEDANNYEDSIRLADVWTDILAKRFRLKERHKVRFRNNTYGDGVKVLKVGERGYWNLAYLADYGVPMSFLIEPMFANKKSSESARFFTDNGKNEYIQYIVDMIRDL